MFSATPPAYSSGLMKFVAWGENNTPASNDITTLVSRGDGGKVRSLTGLREIESLLQQE
jgi:hypothetical protein